jgi:subtilisin family serine protease
LFNVVLPGGDTLRLTLTYMCGNRWRLRNPHAQALDVTWDVFRTTARGALTLPARIEGTAFSETFFETPVVGTTRVFYSGRLVQTKAHGNRGCAGITLTIPVTQRGLDSAFYASVGFVNEPETPNTWYRGIFFVEFRDHIPVAERQRILDSLGAELIGGVLNAYTVRIRTASDFVSMRDLTLALQSHPTIRWFIPSKRSGAVRDYWLRPRGSAAWRNMALRPSPEARLFGNFESSQAPLAWGCSTGDVSTSIGVFDSGFDGWDKSGDLAPTEIRNSGSPSEFRPRGASVAHVLAATGDNDFGRSGVVWRSALRLRRVDALPEVVPDISSSIIETQHLIELGRKGPIVNVSVGALATELNRLVAKRVLGTAIETLRREGRYPLFVLAAGNDGLDARTAGYTRVAELYPDQVLVIGTSETKAIASDGAVSFKRASSSNRGSLVSLYAPATDILVDSAGEDVILEGGSSFAAPLVSGTAALLVSFDSRLADASEFSTREIRRLLLDGAFRAGPDAESVASLNAYGALRSAANRSGAPLCGNRLWGDGPRVMTNRAAGQEIVLTAPGDVGDIIAHHGGKRLDITYRAFQDFEPYWAQATYRWTPGGWMPGAEGGDAGWGTEVGGTAAGTARSRGAVSHDGTLAYGVSAEPAGSGTEIIVHEWRVDGTGGRVVGRYRLGAAFVSVDSACTVRASGDVCVRFAYGGSSLSFSTTVSPMGDAVFVGVTQRQIQVDVGTGFEPCPAGIGVGRCFAYGLDVLPENSWLLRFSLADSTLATPLSQGVQGAVGQLSVSEDGHEIFVGRGIYAATSQFRWTDQGWDIVTNESINSCRLEWRSTQTGIETFGREVASPVNCTRATEASGFSAVRAISSSR